MHKLFIFSNFVKNYTMKVNGINEVLSYCLYVCDDEILKIELYNLQRLFIAGFLKRRDIKRLYEIEEEIQKQFRD